MSTLYASFANPSDAERATGALLDHGAVADDISLLANERTVAGQPVAQTSEVPKSEQSAKSGISTTTSFDVAAGTVKGATIGIGVGTLAALASLFIPGLGLVVGGGALAAALMGGAGTVIAGAAAGGITGFLADQGIPVDVVTRYSSTFQEGGAILAIAVPSGKLESADVEALLVKYGAGNIATVNAARTLVEGAAMPSPDPLIVQGENPDIAPVMYASQPSAVVATETVPLNPADPLDQRTVQVVPVSHQAHFADQESPTPAAEPLVDIIDPVSGQIIRKPFDAVVPGTEDSQISTLVPNQEVVEDAGGHLHQTVGRGTVISEKPVVVTDPVTGLRQPAHIVEEQHAVVRQPSVEDGEGHVSLSVDGPEETVIVREKHIEYPQ